MSARHYVRDATGTLVEVTDRILREGWTVKEAAEEGKTPITQIAIADPAMDFDIVAHRLYLIVEDESESPDDVLFAGFTADQKISRGWGEDGQPLGRLWIVSLSDANAVWMRRVMVGADCKRPRETDVERMAWLLSTAEADMFDNVTDFVSTASPVAMDKVDYRGQMFNQIADDCAQATGKNWYAWYRLNETTTDRELTAWYGSESLTAHASTLFLSNDSTRWTDAELEDGTSLVWPISDDTEESRSGSRVYAGIYLPFDGGATYRWNGATATAFAKRDAVMPTLNVKSKAKAVARALRYLAAFSEQDLTATTTVELPAAKATLIRTGMRIPFEATHTPDYGGGDFHWTRILECTPSPVAAGDRYRLALVLSSPGGVATLPWVCPLDPGAVPTESKTYPPLGGAMTDADGNVWYASSNLSWFPGDQGWNGDDGPLPNTECRGLGFPDYADALGDGGGPGVHSQVLFTFAGPGTAVWTWNALPGETFGNTWYIYYQGPSGPTLIDSGAHDAPGTLTLTAPDLPADAVSCYMWMVYQIGTRVGVGHCYFDGIVWSA